MAAPEKNVIKIGKRSFLIGGMLGKGGFSEVKLGTETKTKKRVALKFTYKKNAENSASAEDQYQQMAQEIRALRKLNHPNVIRLLGYDLNAKIENKDVIVMVQELCPNGELFDYVMYTGSFDKLLARSVFTQVMHGVKACHDAKVAHRDLKPENLLFDIKYNIKLVDLGFAAQFDQVCMSTELGTQGYMAPEIYEGKEYTQQVDVFSAGVILFIIFTGFPPFRKVSEHDWFFKRWKKQRYEDLWAFYEKKTGTMDDSFKELITGMLQSDPTKRWTVEQVLKSDWLSKGDLLKGQSLYSTLDARKKAVDQKKPKAQTRATMVEAIEHYFEKMNQEVKEKKIEKVPLLTLAKIARNEYREGLNQCTTEKEIREILTQMETTSKRLLGKLGNAKFLKDPVVVAQELARVCDSGPNKLDKLIEFEGSEGSNHLVMEALNYNEIIGEVPAKPSLFKFLDDNMKLDSETPPKTVVDYNGINGYLVGCSAALILYALQEYQKNDESNEKSKSKSTTVSNVTVEKEIQLPELCTLTVDYYEEWPIEDEEGKVEFGQKKFEFYINVKIHAAEEGKNFVVFTRKSKDYGGLTHFNDTIRDILNGSLLGPLCQQAKNQS